jgi:hypothetical protein
VRTIDIVPTLLELAGISNPEDLDGVSLVPFLDGARGDVPNEAWSYAASSNYGLSVRVANQQKYILNTTAWSTIPQVEQLYDLATDQSEARNLARDDRETARLRERAVERIRKDATGLHLHFENPTSAALWCRLHGRNVVHPSRLKSDRASGGRVQYLGRGSALVTVAPGADFTLYAEGEDLGKIGIELGAREEAQPELSLSLMAAALVGHPRLIARLGNQWTEIDQPPPSGVPLMTLMWRGLAPPARTDDHLSHDDPSVHRQLEALGYLE